jgi:hypothetical protein
LTGRINNQWTRERLEQCRRHYEEGASNQALGAMFGIKPGSVAVMAWQHKWRRAGGGKAKPSRVVAGSGAVALSDPLNPPIPPTRMEIAFNGRLCAIIRDYWRAQGRTIELSIETMGSGIQCIRSRSINGVPTE